VSDLQLALLAVAAMVLLALYANGKWQERRLLRRMRERLHGGVGDPLFQSRPERDSAGAGGPGQARAMEPAAGGRMDPVLGQGANEPEADYEFVVAGKPGGGGPAADPQRGEEPSPGVTSEPLLTPAALLQPNWVEDPLLDCTLEIRCARAVDGVSVIDAAALLANANWRLPVNFVVWDGRHQQWVLPDRFGYYNDALASIQLADRRARADSAELQRFVQIVQQVAGKLDADVDAPDIPRLLSQAEELDRLCARFDIKIGITVESTGGVWTGPQLRNCAQEVQLAPVSATGWVRYDERGDPLYRLQTEASLTRLLLEFDIAVAPVAAQGFRTMVADARALAAALGARVVDDNGNPIEDKSVDAIDNQLARVIEEMRGAGIEPGSARARRLYV